MRGGLIGAACAAAMLCLLAWIAGPVVSPVSAATAGLLVLSTWVGVAWWVARPERAAAIGSVAALLDNAAQGFGSRALSALQLTAATGPSSSAALVEAHAASVLIGLDELPARQVVPIALGRERNTWLSIGALCLCAWTGTQSSTVGAGLFALTHPSPMDASGARSSNVIEHATFSLRFPSYLQRATETLIDPAEILVPRGTAVEVTLEARVDATAAELHVASLEAPLQAHDARHFSGRFVARDSGPLRIRLQHDDEWISDRAPRKLTTINDTAPTIEIMAPRGHTVVAPDASFELAFRVSDDAGLATIELVTRAPAGKELRRRLWTSSPSVAGASETLQTQQLTLLAAELLAKPGDVVELWIEATDRSAFNGPNRARSEVVRIEIASSAGLKLQARKELREIVNRMLDVLADRLERVPSDDEAAIRAYVSGLFDKTRAFLALIDVWLANNEESDSVQHIDLEGVRSIASRHRRLLTEEQALHGHPLSAIGARVAVERRSIEGLEGDVIFLSDLIGRTHLAEAEALAQELDQIRKTLTELMKRLESTDDEQARKDMLAAIERAKERLARLMQSIGQLAENVPGEFVNADALQGKSTDDSLSALQKALQSNDLKGAEQELAALSQNVDQLQQALRDGTLSFSNDRFGERDRAMEAARSELNALAEEQARLAQRSGEVLKRVGERIAQRDGAQSVSPALAQKAKAARDAVDAIDRNLLGSAATQELERVSQRLSDTTDAMNNGDMLEAERMAGLAADDASELERDLDIMRRMFPGSRGETGRNADHAARAKRALDGLRNALAQRTPDVSNAMNAADRADLQHNADPQHSVREGTGRLASSLEQGADGAPPHQRASQGLRNAERAMQRAEQALRSSDPQAAAASQAEASDALEGVREAMRQEQSGQGRGRRSGDSGSDDGSGQGHVQIPDGSARGNDELRRKLMDGMRDSRPSGYESAVERYYRELLE